jgi:hypothetical protein
MAAAQGPYKVIKVLLDTSDNHVSAPALQKAINEVAKDGWQLVEVVWVPIKEAENNSVILCIFRKAE